MPVSAKLRATVLCGQEYTVAGGGIQEPVSGLRRSRGPCPRGRSQTAAFFPLYTAACLACSPASSSVRGHDNEVTTGRGSSTTDLSA